MQALQTNASTSDNSNHHRTNLITFRQIQPLQINASTFRQMKSLQTNETTSDRCTHFQTNASTFRQMQALSDSTFSIQHFLSDFSVFIVCINVSFMTLMILSVIHQKLVEKPSAKIFCQNTCFCSSLFKCIQRCIPLVDDRPIFVSKSKTKSSVHQHQAIDHDTPVVRSRRKIPADWKNHSRDSSIGFFSASGDSNPLYNKQTKGDGTGGKVVE